MARHDPEQNDPVIRDVGLTGVLVTFAGTLSEAANRAALAFRAAVEAQAWDGVEETATSLTSVYLRFDPLMLDHDALNAQLKTLLASRDWRDADLPQGRRHLRIPVVLGGDHGPQFTEASDLTELDAQAARDSIAAARIRVLSIGFAPGQAYMGQLDPAWDIPRMTRLNPRVPGGALVVAIRQLIIFGRDAPTGWRHIGQTAFKCYRPGADRPFGFSLGDEVSFRVIASEELDDIRARDNSGDGGAEIEDIG